MPPPVDFIIAVYSHLHSSYNEYCQQEFQKILALLHILSSYDIFS